MSRELSTLEFVAILPAEAQVTMPLYCSCLDDVRSESKERQLNYMSDFEQRLHTIGVTASEAEAYYRL